MNNKTAKGIIEKSKAGYDRVSKQFSQTRNVFWPEFGFIKDYVKDGGIS